MSAWRLGGLFLALGIWVVPPGVAAQQPAKSARVGVLRPAPDNPVFQRDFEGFRQVLRESGYVEGKNLALEYRVRPGSSEEIHALAGELVRLKVDAVLAISPVGVAAAAKATTTLPIVAVDLETDPMAAALVASLARPGGNITGLFLDFPELSGKWLEMLKEVVPRLSRVAGPR